MLRTAAAALTGLALLLTVLAGAAGGLASTLPGSHGGSQPSQDAMADIPADYLILYQAAAATCPGLNWAVLAAIGKIESDHGRSTLPGVHNGHSQAGAEGPMQFLAATFAEVVARHPPPAGGAAPPSPYNPQDAVYTAAAYLCDKGARDSRDLHHSLWTYNHSEDYLSAVLAQAARYSQPAPTSVLACRSFQSTVQSGTEDFSSSLALTAVRFACGQLGRPYVWGGNGDPGFDCSGLTHAAYAAAGIDIPRTAQIQYNAGPLLPMGTPLQPGDLVFFGAPGRIHHVGISLGGTLIVHAPDVNQVVRVEDYRDFPDLAGASRPTVRLTGGRSDSGPDGV
ncbi:MAG TPA: C40 family peptidase [Acidimicrobiia bacterium]